ncbi:cation:proton antiporter [Falsihalocynthiibacter sp. SS001]|uniref:cation:proton antiporter n=1 Tax=Falsihalocynthiibacter sp. SS001 TaxID=3349698 RepID=UPI0036D3CB43
MTAYLAFAFFLFAFSTVAKRLSSTVVTAPMAFLAFGVLLDGVGLIPEDDFTEILHLVAEVTLVVLLFLDAAKINIFAVKKRHVWPERMLAIGLPVGFVLGIAVGWLIMPGWPLAAIALISAILVPTDAALGLSVVTNKAVPERARRALTIESGLNDGLALPLVLISAAFASEAAFAPSDGWGWFITRQLVLGPIAGIVIGTVGAMSLARATREKLTSDTFEGLAALALAALSYTCALSIGGNGFIAAFVAGLSFGAIVRGQFEFVYEFTESEGQLLSWVSFFLLGAVLVPEAIASLDMRSFVLILSSLVIVRPVAIWISLIGTDASPLTRLFFGWFGPRGLATALFAMLVYEDMVPEFGESVLNIAINAVWISALLHGVTATLCAPWFGNKTRNLPENIGEDS